MNIDFPLSILLRRWSTFELACYCFSGSPYDHDEGSERVMKGKKEGRNDGQTIVRGWSGWSKLTVTTSIRSLGKNFLSTGADQSRDAKASRGPKRIFNRIAIVRTLSPSFSHNEDATAISLFRFQRPLRPSRIVYFPRIRDSNSGWIKRSKNVHRGKVVIVQNICINSMKLNGQNKRYKCTIYNISMLLFIW